MVQLYIQESGRALGALLGARAHWTACDCFRRSIDCSRSCAAVVAIEEDVTRRQTGNNARVYTVSTFERRCYIGGLQEEGN